MFNVDEEEVFIVWDADVAFIASTDDINESIHIFPPIKKALMNSFTLSKQDTQRQS